MTDDDTHVFDVYQLDSGTPGTYRFVRSIETAEYPQAALRSVLPELDRPEGEFWLVERKSYGPSLTELTVRSRVEFDVAVTERQQEMAA